MSEERGWGPLTLAYGHLVRAHMYAARNGDEAKRKRIFETLDLLQELYPVETALWDNYYAPEPTPIPDEQHPHE